MAVDPVAGLALPRAGCETSRSARTALGLGLTLLLSASAFQPAAGGLLLQLLRPGGSELTYEHGRHGERLLDADSFYPAGSTAGATASRVGRDLYFRDWLNVTDDAGPLAGPDLDAASCAACHVPAMITARHREPGFSEQLIWPYSDLALHDMGDDLADPGDSPLAREWRTAPLWGLGLVEERLPARGFLHDGRARTLEEAVLWHGGEAAASRRRFARLPVQSRETLLRFIRSL